MEYIFSDVQCCLCRISSSDVYACTSASNAIFLLDGVNHKISIKEYSYIKNWTMSFSCPEGSHLTTLNQLRNIKWVNVFKLFRLFIVTGLSAWWRDLWFISGYSLLLLVGTSPSLRRNIKHSTMRMSVITFLHAMTIVWFYHNRTKTEVRSSL